MCELCVVPRFLLRSERAHDFSSASRQLPSSIAPLSALPAPIHIEGSLSGEKIRKALDLTSWEAASNSIAKWNASGQIGVTRQDVPSIAEAVGKHIADGEARNLKPESCKKIRDVVERRFLAFCVANGYRELRQIDVDAVREFRNKLVEEYSANSARKRLEYVRAFFDSVISRAGFR